MGFTFIYHINVTNTWLAVVAIASGVVAFVLQMHIMRNTRLLLRLIKITDNATKIKWAIKRLCHQSKYWLSNFVFANWQSEHTTILYENETKKIRNNVHREVERQIILTPNNNLTLYLHCMQFLFAFKRGN